MSRSTLRLTSTSPQPSSLLNLPSALRPTIYANSTSSPPHTRHNATTYKPKRPRTALFFPGQGVQRVGMTQDWLAAFPRTVKPILDEIDSILNYKLSKVIADGPTRC